MSLFNSLLEFSIDTEDLEVIIDKVGDYFLDNADIEAALEYYTVTTRKFSMAALFFKRIEKMEKLGIDELYDFVLKRLLALYSRHRRKYKGNPDSKQMCCMWSTLNPPDTIENTAPILDLQKEFDIYLNEDGALEFYDLLLPEAAERIIELMRQRMRRTNI